jgi:hypothetical protein
MPWDGPKTADQRMIWRAGMPTERLRFLSRNQGSSQGSCGTNWKCYRLNTGLVWIIGNVKAEFGGHRMIEPAAILRLAGNHGRAIFFVSSVVSALVANSFSIRAIYLRDPNSPCTGGEFLFDSVHQGAVRHSLTHSSPKRTPSRSHPSADTTRHSVTPLSETSTQESGRPRLSSRPVTNTPLSR